MSEAPPDVSLSIVSFGTRDLLRECLASIAALPPGVSVQTIVVDNASTDGSAEMVVREFPWVELIRNESNRYFATGHNQAFARARGRYVGILNSDTLLLPDTLRRMVAFMDAHPDAGASTCEYVRPDGMPLKAEAHNHWRFHSVYYHALCRNTAGERLYRLFGGRASEPIRIEADAVETDVVSDTFLFVRKSVLDRIGGYDERLRLYATEDDICASIKRAGARVYYYQGARIVHALSASVRKSSPFRIRWILAVDLMRYHVKRGSLPTRVLAMPLLFGAFLADAAVIVSRGGRWK
jgi:GT2 family glycosyltransferase